MLTSSTTRHAGLLFLLATGCADLDHALAEPTESAGVALQLQTSEPEPPLIVARGAFASDADRQRFEEDVLPSAQAFLTYWADAGLHVPHGQARIFISPPPGTKALEALPKLYGETIFDEMYALEELVASAASNQAARDLVETFACAHPPLHRSMVEDIDERLASPELTPALIAEALRRRHDELSAEETTFSFHADNGEFELPVRQQCSFILAGYATDGTRAHPFLEKDLINHELGHALHYGLWLESGVLGERLSSSANESIADILAHVFDGDVCHGKKLDEAGNVVGCRRTMLGYDSSVSDAVWLEGRGSHATGQALRDVIWTLRSQVEPATLKQAIRAGIAAIQPVLNAIDEEPLANVPVFDDEILSIRYRFVREYEATSAFFRAVCEHVGANAVCDEHAARIGDPRISMRDTWLRHAPTAIGEAGMWLADGRRVAFEVDGALLPAMSVTALDGTVTRYAEATGIDRDSTGRVTMWFGTSELLGWTSDATLVTRPASDARELPAFSRSFE
ncbi:MAG: hypothetical protein ABW321_21010 [Polyangiales bacterium]